MVEVQPEDYATARGVFRTKLLRKGPSPQPWEPMSLPVGVNEVEYSSDKLRLKAWVIRTKDGNSERPGVLFLHGGFTFGLEGSEVSQPFRDAGYIVLTPILRAENRQPGAFTFSYDKVDDVLATAG
jgi:dipeptidyl aminopeptidase/acylaminoacyl peptidase